MNKFLKIFFVTILICLIPTFAEASCNILIDGEALVCLDSNGNVIEPFIENGTTYIPVRAVATAFDTEVFWDQDTKTVFIGEMKGTPALTDHVNIYAKGEEFICRDANGMVVFPILREGATYLPIRGIGELFGKRILWDNISKTAVLTTPPSADEKSFLKDSVTNTENLLSLNVLCNIDASISMNGQVIQTISKSETEVYSPWTFSLSSFLPDNYMDNTAYLGNGNYFIVVSPEKFASAPNLVRILSKNNVTATYSPIYMTLNINGGYITEAGISFSADAEYKGLVFRENYIIKATMLYPDGFVFPSIPYPETSRGENESFIPVDNSENSDSNSISLIITKYVGSTVSKKPKEVLDLMYSEDYKSLFGNKSKAQFETESSVIKKNLMSRYKNSTGAYTVNSMVYIDASGFERAERAAKAEISLECTNGDETTSVPVVLTLKKIDGTWYIDSSVVKDLLK